MQFLFRLLFLLLILAPSIAGADEIILEFDQLAGMLEASPSGRLLLSERDARLADAQSALQWTNPELEVEREALSSDMENETETLIAVGKSFKTPWAGAAHRKAQRFDKEAIEYDIEYQKLLLLADWKSMYVDLKLKQMLQSQLADFQDMIQEVSQISADRREQGTTSGLEDQLLQMSLFNVKATMLHLNSDIRQLENSFKNQLGVPVKQSLILKSQIGFSKISLNSVQQDGVVASPQLKSLQSQMASAKKMIAMEKGNVLPELHVTGGYKQVNDELSGSVIGLSIPLPILNTNRAAVQRAQARMMSKSIEYDLTRAELVYKIQESTILIRDAQSLLDEYADMFSSTRVMSDLVFSFKEGWITLTDLLSGIQVYADALESYYTHLAHYYDTIFYMEVLTGEELVQF